MRKYFFPIFCFLLFSLIVLLVNAQTYEVIDLEAKKQDFVLYTKKLTIPGYPDAFNPSIIKWKGSFIMSFRARDPITKITSIVGFVWLDRFFNPEGPPQILEIHNKYPSGSLIQDPRLIVINEKLFMVYSNIWNTNLKDVRRIFIAEIEYDDDRFIAKDPEVFLLFDGDPQNKFEKNWVPFEYNGDLLLAYSINPHKIFLPLSGTKSCTTVAWSKGYFQWNWGELRGGSAAQIVDDEYLAFFHSSKVIRSTQSNSDLMTHYFMGAYTFERNPPFALKKVSRQIIVGKNFYNGPAHQTWKPLRVVFPCGFVFDKNFIWVSYGRQDHEIWIVKLDKEKLIKSLSTVLPVID